jgi:cytochrome c553
MRPLPAHLGRALPGTVAAPGRALPGTVAALGRALLGTVLALGLGHAASAQDYGLGPSHGPTAEELEQALSDPGEIWRGAAPQQADEAMIERGRLVAMGGSAQGGAMMACITCHGTDGRGDGSGAFPRLTNQPAWYLYKQLRDYASGARPNRVMSGVADRLTDAEMEAVSAYYAALEAPFRPVSGEVNGLLLQWGGQLAAVGSAEKGIPACVNCHGASGSGLPPSVPYLAGQYAGYMTLQLQLWKAGIRDNDSMNVMAAIAAKMTEEDMRAVSEYFARVRPEGAGIAPVARSGTMGGTGAVRGDLMGGSTGGSTGGWAGAGTAALPATVEGTGQGGGQGAGAGAAPGTAASLLPAPEG